MAKTGQYLCLCLVVILVLSIALLIKPSSEQSNPSAPEFTVRFVGPAYTVSKISLYDSAKSEFVTYEENFTIEYTNFEIKIRNQPNTPDNYYFQIRSKMHSSQNWTTWYYFSDSNLIPRQSSSEYTVLTYAWTGNFIQGVLTHEIYMPNNTKVDVQIQSMIGSFGREVEPPYQFPAWVFRGVTSDWSNQTITTGAVTLNTKTVPEFPLTAFLIVVLAVVSLLLIIGKRKPAVTDIQ
jgi:hypothetical protein